MIITNSIPPRHSIELSVRNAAPSAAQIAPPHGYTMANDRLRAPPQFFDVRFTPNNDRSLRRREMTLCANSDQSAPQQI